MSMRVPTLVLMVGFIAGASAASASDPWEFGSYTGGDDDAGTANTLSHGIVQQHDMDEAGGANDQDWMQVATIARHSYEGRLSGTNVFFSTCGSCAFFDRVDGVGTVLTPSQRVVSAVGEFDRTVVWIAAATTVDFLRTAGDQLVVDGPGDVYTIRFWDTTYGIPRWNNAGGQATVFVISNMTDRTVTGQVDFYNVGGTLLFTRLMTILPNQLHTFNTATEPLLAGLSGHAYVAHDAGYGGLVGKAVALDPATGFSFDTLMIPFAN